MQKKKLSLALKIFIALVLAIVAGLVFQNQADILTTYVKPFGNDIS